MDKHLKRQLKLAGLLTENKKNVLPNVELIKEGNDGITYAVIRENRKYFIKTAKTKEGLIEEDFDFLHGLANKGRNTFKSYEDATFKLNLIFEDINRTFGGTETNILENDINEKRYVLKLPKPKEPETDFGDEEGGDEDFDLGGEDDSEGGDDEFDFGDDSEGGDEEGGDDEFDFGGEEGGDDSEEGDEFDFGGEEGGDEEGDEEFDLGDEEGSDEFSDDGVETGDTIKDIQKLTGKLGQQIRDTEDLSSDMQKWVAKSVMSALKPETMGSSDKEDIINTINSGGDVDEVVLGVDIEPNDPSLTGPGGGEIEEPPFNQDWGLPKYDDVSENDEDNENTRRIAKQNDPNYQDGDDISAISGALAMDREQEANVSEDDEERGGETHDTDELLFSSEEMYGKHPTEDEPKSYRWDISSMEPKDIESEREKNQREFDKHTDKLENKQNIEEDDGILRAKDLPSGDEEEYDSPDPRLTSGGGEPWNLPMNGNDPTVSRRGMYRNESINDKMSSMNQLNSYLGLSGLIKEQGFSLDFSHKKGSTVFLDIREGETDLAKMKLDRGGNMDVGYMEDDEFIGEPLDSMEDINDYLEIDNEDMIDNMDMRNAEPAEPTTKPTTKPETRPSRRDRPFNPPSPNEDPNPKAVDEDSAAEPAEPTTKPTTKPETRPSRRNRPFSPPEPNENPNPKAGFGEDDDVDFE